MATVNLPKVAASAWVCSSSSPSSSSPLTPGDGRPRSSRWSSRRSAVPLETLLSHSPSFLKLQKGQLHYPGELQRNLGTSHSRRKGGRLNKALLLWNPKEAVLTGIEDTSEGGVLFKFGQMEQLLALDKLLSFLKEGDQGLDNWMARASSSNNLIELLYEMLGVDTLSGKLKMSDSLPSYLKYDNMNIDFGEVNTEEMVSHILASMTSTSKIHPVYDEASLLTDFDSISDSDWWRTFDGIFGLGENYSGQPEKFSFSGFEKDSDVLKKSHMADPTALYCSQPGAASDISMGSFQQDLDRRRRELTSHPNLQPSLRFYMEGTGIPTAGRRLENDLFLDESASGMEFTRLDFVRNESLPLPWLEEKIVEETPGFLWLTREADGASEVLELEKPLEVSVITSVVAEETVEIPDVPQAVANMEASSAVATEKTTETKKVKSPKNAPHASKRQQRTNSRRTSSGGKTATNFRTRSDTDSFDFLSSYHSNSVSGALGLLGMRQDYAAELAGGLNQISVFLAGGGLACILQVAARMLGLNPAFDFGKVVVLVRGCGLMWMSAAVHNLQRVLFMLPQACHPHWESEQVMRVATELRHISFKAFTFVILSIIVGGL